MIFYGTEADCRAVREALDFAEGYPFWPQHPVAATAAQENLRQQWLAADIAGKALLEAGNDYDGWTLHREEVYPVDEPGFGWRTIVPDDVLSIVVPNALNGHNRTLSLARLQTLQSAFLVLQEELPPAWVPEE